MQNYLDQNQQRLIKYRDFPDKNKKDYNTRILCLNVNEIRCKNIKKVIQFIDFSKKNKVDLVILTEINSK